MKGSDFKTRGPDKDIIEMTRMIIKQNDEILAMNRILIESFANPVLCINPGAEEINESHVYERY